MDQDIYNDAVVQQTQQDTQQATQSTQDASQPPEWNAHIWGFFVPCKDTNKRIDCWKTLPTVKIGRNPEENDILLRSMKISNRHCDVHWDGKEDQSSIVTVHDLSSNGTFINGTKIGKGMTAILREGNEIGFGAWAPHHGGEDYRYIFRFTASGPPGQGIYKYYDIGHELGHGSFATVRSAINRSTGKTYAVKIVHRSKFRTSGSMSKEMFMREVSILERLKHRNIVELEEVFQDEQSIYLVLEYVDGGDLLDYIIARSGLKEQESQELTAQLCEALEYIHSKGIAHRDLKPENVLLTKDRPPKLKVADFGLAKAVDSMTKFKTTCGTPCYLAPEVVLRGPGQGYDHLADSWSIGVIVFSMISNASPFIEEEGEHIRARFKNRYIDWKPFLDASVSDAAYDFVDRLLQENPRHRMSMSEALIHPWIAPFVSFPEALAQSQSQGRQLRRLESAQRQYVDAIPIGVEMGVRVEDFDDPEEPSLTPIPRRENEFPYVAAGVSEEFDQIQMDDVQEDAPQSQSQAVRQPLKSRIAALAESDPDGRMQSFELVYPVPAETENDHGTHRGKGRNGKRRAHDGDHDDEMDASGGDSPLTPVVEDADGMDHGHDGEDHKTAAAHISAHTHTRGTKTRGAKKSRATTDGIRKTRATTGANTRAGQRTRTAAGAGDVDM